MKRIGFIDGRRVAGWSFPATTTPGDGQVITINDPSTIASGTIHGIHINYTASGIKTGGTVMPLAVTLAVTGDTPYAYAMRVTTAAVANKTMEMLMGLDIYMGDAGTAVGRFYAFNLGMVHNSVPLDQVGFMRLRNHGARTMSSVIRLEGTNPVARLFDLQAGQPYHSGNRTVPDGSIQVRVEGVDKWIQLYAS